MADRAKTNQGGSQGQSGRGQNPGGHSSHSESDSRRGRPSQGNLGQQRDEQGQFTEGGRSGSQSTGQGSHGRSGRSSENESENEEDV